VTTLKQAHASLNAANQALARTTPGSKGRQRAKSRLAKRHRKVANTRRHLVHQASKALVERCQVLVIEDLNVAGMVRNRRLAKSVSDAAMGELSVSSSTRPRWHGRRGPGRRQTFSSSKTCFRLRRGQKGPRPVARTTHVRTVGLGHRPRSQRRHQPGPLATQRVLRSVSVGPNARFASLYSLIPLDLAPRSTREERSSPAQPSRQRDEGLGSEPSTQSHYRLRRRTVSKHRWAICFSWSR